MTVDLTVPPAAGDLAAELVASFAFDNKEAASLIVADIERSGQGHHVAVALAAVAAGLMAGVASACDMELTDQVEGVCRILTTVCRPR